MSSDLFNDLKELLSSVRVGLPAEDEFRSVQQGVGSAIAVCGSVTDVEYMGATAQQGALRFGTRGNVVVAIYAQAGGAKVEVAPRAQKITGFDHDRLLELFYGRPPSGHDPAVCSVAAGKLTGEDLERFENSVQFAVAELTSH